MTETPLVVVTRPQGRAEKVLHLCRSAGWAVRHLPLMRLQENAAFSGNLNEMVQAADVVFFVSPSAVELAVGKINWQLFSGSLVTVGQASAEALQSMTNRGVLYPQNGKDSEALLQLPLWSEKCGRLLIVRGVGGRELAADDLRTRGWLVDCADIYQRIAQYPNLIEQNYIFQYPGAVAVLLTSTESAHIWLDALAPQYSTLSKRLLYFTIHPRISDVLRQVGMENVRDFHDENEIVAALHRQWS